MFFIVLHLACKANKPKVNYPLTQLTQHSASKVIFTLILNAMFADFLYSKNEKQKTSGINDGAQIGERALSAPLH